MPKLPVAHQSSAHRLACLSLYRALLKQSSALAATQSGGLRSLIRHRFKTDRLLQSPSQIDNGLDAGNEALTLLCASAQGERNSITRLGALLESTLKLSESNEAYRNALRTARAPMSPRLTPKARHVRLSTDKTLQSRRPNSRPILERPLPLSEIKSGKRRVPKFMAVQGVPFLLYSKPQPLSVGRVLRQKAAWHNKKWDQRTKLMEENIPLGADEDAWDALIALQKKQEGLSNERSMPGDDENDIVSNAGSWNAVSRFAEASIAQRIRNYDQRNLEASRRMVEIMKQERVLAAKETAGLESRRYEQRLLRRADDFLATATGKQRSRKDGERNTQDM